MEHTFTLTYQVAGDIDGVVDSLGAGGCTDALVGLGLPGCIVLEFSRESTCLCSALMSAIEDVTAAAPSASLLSFVSLPLSGCGDARSFPSGRHAAFTIEDVQDINQRLMNGSSTSGLSETSRKILRAVSFSSDEINAAFAVARSKVRS
jgi:hypothetical protein